MMAAWLADGLVVVAVLAAAGYWLRRLHAARRPAASGCSSCAACTGCAAVRPKTPAAARQSR